MNLKPVTRLIVTSLLAFGALDASAGSYCGSLTNAFGPFDYRKSQTEFPKETYLVEMAHFTPEVENLIKGNSSYIGGDLDYTLRAFPNHHRALASVAKLALKEKTPKDPNMHYSFTCYFERAMRFTPDDDGVFVVYGTYLYKRGDIAGATTQLKHALSLNPENPAANYNLGLIYINQNKPDEARVYAKKAEALDYPLHALKDRLTQAGKW